MKKFRVTTFLAFLASLAFLAQGHCVPLTLVVDPAHGGEDRGAVGPSGVEEAALTWQWAVRLRDRLAQDSDFFVILTRDQDVAVTRDQRATVANQAKAHLWVSVHANQSPAKESSGMIVRLYKPPSSAKRQGSGSLIPWRGAQAAFVSKSRMAAGDCVEALKRVGPTELWEGPWVDLRSVALPAVSIELGYMSADSDLEKLKDNAWQGRVVEELVNALKTYRRRIGL